MWHKNIQSDTKIVWNWIFDFPVPQTFACGSKTKNYKKENNISKETIHHGVQMSNNTECF